MERTKSSTKRIKVYSIVLSIAFMVLLFAFVFIFHRAGYDKKVLVKLGLMEPQKIITTDYADIAVLAWDNCLQKLDYDAEIAFLGDSITRGSDFREYFDGKKIVNLGYGGDSIVGLTKRVSMVAAVSPEKVFVMGGINGLTDLNIDKSSQSYSELLDKLITACPEAKIYVLSVLPVSAERESTLMCHNETIETFNEIIKEQAIERNCVFVDLFYLYCLDGEMNPALTIDGVHITTEAYDLWADAIRQYIN